MMGPLTVAFDVVFWSGFVLGVLLTAACGFVVWDWRYN